MTQSPDFAQLARRFDVPGMHSVALVGSHVRGEAGPYSDIDLVRFLGQDTESLPDSGSHLVDGRLVVVSDVRPADIETWFSHPEKALNHIPGLRQARPLLDRDGRLARLQQRAEAFTWDEEIQARANAWASEQMVGWIEEVHKGLEGLRRNNIGRLLNARFGLSWGLSRVMQVQRGVFLSGDNDFFTAVEEAIGRDTEWARLRRIVFSVEGPGDSPATLHEQVIAGLRLYVVTAEMLVGILRPADAPLVNQTVARIRNILEDSFQ
jgi:hypothetical protein